MSTGSRRRTVQAEPPAEDKAERRRMSLYDLFFLAAGGVIGSGWLFPDMQDHISVSSWLIGGALMLVITAVMVELSTVVPKTGGLIFLPLQSSGPLLATVVAAGVWVWYAVNPASEAAAMVRGVAGWSGDDHSLINGCRLTEPGIGWAVLFLLLIVAINMLGPRLFLMINNVLTAFKLLVPLLMVVLLLYTMRHSAAHPAHFPPLRDCPNSRDKSAHPDLDTVLKAVTGSGVIYAYLGFQGPLDFAGSVRRRSPGEAARLRWAVYGTVCGSIFLYVALQYVVTYMQSHPLTALASTTQSPYPGFAAKVAPPWAAPLVRWLVNLDTVLSPFGTAMVFTYVLTREVAALSRAHLTHRGLQQSKYSVIPLAGDRVKKLFGDDRLDVYWLILIVDLFASVIALLCFGANWDVLGVSTGVLALIVYSTASVVFISLRRREPGRFSRLRYSVLAEIGFVSISVWFFLTGWDKLWPGLAALTAGCLLLFGLPLLLPTSRWYDATAHAAGFRRLRRGSPEAWSATLLFVFFAGLWLASFLENRWQRHGEWDVVGLAVIAVLAWVVFRHLVGLSVRYMSQHPPTLPAPMPVPGPAGSEPSGETATEPSG